MGKHFLSIAIVVLFLTATLVISFTYGVVEDSSQDFIENQDITARFDEAKNQYVSGNIDEAIDMLHELARAIEADQYAPDDDITFLRVKHWHTQYVGECVQWNLSFYRMGATSLIGSNYHNSQMTISDLACSYFGATFLIPDSRSDAVVCYFNNEDRNDLEDYILANGNELSVTAVILPPGDTRTIPVLRILSFGEPIEVEEEE